MAVKKAKAIEPEYHSSKKIEVSIPQFSKKSLIISILVLFLLAIAAAPGYYFYREYQKAQLQLKNPTKAAEMEIEDIVKKVGNHMLLPSGEKPTMATVSDVNKLKGQTFFSNAQNGDKVLIYGQAKKAILYRPSQDKIVEVSPLQLAEKTQTQTTTPTAAPKQGKKAPYNVAIFNGTTTAGLGGKVQDTLESAVFTIKVTDVLQATKKDYPRTIVVNVSGKATKAELEEIAKAVNGTVTNVAYDEKPPAGTDIAIVVGGDSKPKAATPSPSPTAATTPTSAPEPTQEP